jgi:hypothetical protein
VLYPFSWDSRFLATILVQEAEPNTILIYCMVVFDFASWGVICSQAGRLYLYSIVVVRFVVNLGCVQSAIWFGKLMRDLGSSGELVILQTCVRSEECGRGETRSRAGVEAGFVVWLEIRIVMDQKKKR